MQTHTKLTGQSYSGIDLSSDLTIRLLVHETRRLAHDPFLADRFREAVERGEGEVFRHFDLVRFLASIGLRPLEKFILASAIVTSSSPSHKVELRMQAASIIRAEFDNASLALSQNPSFDQDDLSPDQIAKLLTTVLSDPPVESPVLDAAQRQQIILAALHRYHGQLAAALHQILKNIR